MTSIEDEDTKPLLHDYMSQQEVAEELSVTVETLRIWRVRGGGPHWFRFGMGMRVMYRRQDVRDWIEQQREATTREFQRRLAAAVPPQRRRVNVVTVPRPGIPVVPAPRREPIVPAPHRKVRGKH